MNRFLKIGCLTAVSLLIYCSVTPTFALSNQAEDPCMSLPGNWSGDWNNTHTRCRWKVNMDVVSYKDNVQFVVKFSGGTRECLPEFSATLSGICKDGQLQLDYHNLVKTDKVKMTGRVFGNILTLEDENNWRNVSAYKQT